MKKLPGEKIQFIFHLPFKCDISPRTTDSAAATGDNPAEMKNDSMSSPPPLLFSTKDDQGGQRPVLSPSEIKQEPRSPPPAGAEGAGDEARWITFEFGGLK